MVEDKAAVVNGIRLSTMDELEVQARHNVYPWRYLRDYGGKWQDWPDCAYDWQKKFMRSKHAIRILRANNQGGKTLTGCRDFAMFLLNEHPWKKVEGKEVLRGRIISNHENIKENIVPYLHSVFPEYRTKTTKDGLSYEKKWTIYKERGGVEGGVKIASFDILTIEQDSTLFSGVQLDVLWCDEPIPREIWTESLMRFAATKMNIMVTMTPLLGSVFFYDEVELNKRLDADPIVVHRLDCPHISDERWEAVIAGISDPDEIVARETGQYMSLSGLVFKNYRVRDNEEDFAHLVNESDYHKIFAGKIKGLAPVVQAIDPHGSKHPFLSWGMPTPDKRIIVLDDLPDGRWDREPLYSGSPEKICKMIKQREELHGYRVTKRMMDPKAGKTIVLNKGTMQEIYNKAARKVGLKPAFFHLAKVPGPNERNAIIRGFLENDANGMPRLQVSRRAANTNLGFQRFTYDLKKIKAHPDKDKAAYMEGWKDPIDNVAYLIAGMPGFDLGVMTYKAEHKDIDYFDGVGEKEEETAEGFGRGIRF